jgi:hypothetical protein
LRAEWLQLSELPCDVVRFGSEPSFAASKNISGAVTNYFRWVKPKSLRAFFFFKKLMQRSEFVRKNKKAD